MLSGDGQTVIFTPDPGYSGPATFSFVADDGFSQSAEATVTVNVSDAELLRIHLPRIRALGIGQSESLSITGDFADEAGVVLTPAYLSLTSSAPGVATVDGGGVRGVADGSAVITAERGGVRAVNALSVYTITLDDTGEGEPIHFAELDPDVYPGTLTLPTGGGVRQLRVTTLDGRDVTAATEGTQYFVGNDTIASVTPDGLITALATGRTTLSIVNDGGQSDIELNVVAPSEGPTLLAAANGGAVRSATGETVLVRAARRPRAIY